MTEWQPIETAPKDEPILVYGYSIAGRAAPGGPYRLYVVTVGEIDWTEKCADLLHPGCDCVRQQIVEAPIHWMPLPEAPK